MLKLYHQRPKTLALGVRDREGAASRAVLDGVRTIGAAPRHLAWTPARWMLTLDSNGMHEAKDGVLRTDAEEVVLPLPAIFAAIDAEG
jgi:hypothetical protein